MFSLVIIFFNLSNTNQSIYPKTLIAFKSEEHDQGEKLPNIVLFVAARILGDASGMQVPRYVGFVHGENLLDATAELPHGRRQPKGSLRRGLASDGQ